MIKVKRALISVSDKTGVLEFARQLKALGVEIVSTGGTARLLKDEGVPVQEVSDYTGFPEILDGRVKTLHPVIHGGLLALRDNPQHLEQLKEHHIGFIDMVVVNLYPFGKVIKKKNVTLEEAIENIDIGGPSMLRSAAKNYKSVAVICNPDRYPEIIRELDVNSGILSDTVLFRLAVEVFQLCSGYDSLIHSFLNTRLHSKDFSSFPQDFTLRFSKVQDLRYGENPHQAASFYRDWDQQAGLAAMRQLHGKEISFNNILDLNAAVNFIKDFAGPSAVIVKHNNPTGLAEGETLSQAYQEAWSSDKVSAFGGIVALNRKVDLKTAKLISQSGFMECVIAPGYEKGALKVLSQKKNVRLIEIDLNKFSGESFDFRKVEGGLLLQESDRKATGLQDLKVVTKIKPTPEQMESLLFGWKAIKNVKSNAILLVKGKRVVGIGCGQTSRVESAAIAIQKAGKKSRGSVLISDAFIPKVDTVKIAARAGIKAIIQTGGSIEDANVIKQADKVKLAMVMTGVRHFKH
ncbi:MAG: bifunctional phosphoribosylaminoimidazolecarboxamide formyltransferase/IMP cyclohydrolase [Candidatus Omnitrophota bacterium]